MSPGLAVSKMHGACNDFIVVDTRTSEIPDAPAFARAMCDRHSGIGADGVLLIGASTVADISMRVLNPDGSDAAMCGNGVRCVARYLDERSQGARLRIETLAGIVETEIVERGATYRVRVNMGVPTIENLGAAGTEPAIVSVGNRHFVQFVPSLDDVDIIALGERMQRDPAFASGVNVHAVVLGGDGGSLQMRHYEHGAGATMACGTGAVAAAAAAIERGTLRSPVTVFVPGGEIVVEWDRRGSAFMSGPAVHVFDTVV